MKDNICVLFVDDEKDICEKLATSFELEDFKVLTANSGNHAIEVLKNNPDINFIISDIMMPDGDGLFLLNHIKQNISTQLPIVILSGFSETSESELKKMGALCLIPKPTSVDELIELVRSHT